MNTSDIESIEICPVSHTVEGSIRPPGSKSLTNRALIVAALAKGESKLTGVLDSDDTQVMLESLKRLGLEVTHDAEKCEVNILGCGGVIPKEDVELWLKNSGTSIRFLTAMCALGQGKYRLDGNERMRERPIQHLVEALNQLDSKVVCENNNDCPPVLIEANQLQGGTTTVAGSVSSQYLSALLMVAPCSQQQTIIKIEGELVSKPYVEMTLKVMNDFGVDTSKKTDSEFVIEPQQYSGTNYDVEPDASAASYFFALAAITGGKVTVEGLSKNALQGDIHFVDALEQMGCDVTWSETSVTVAGKPLKGIDIDMNAISDTAQTLAVVAPFAEGPTRIRNVEHMRFKETDRVSAVVTELRKLDLKVEEHTDGMTIHPGTMKPTSIATYDDHRMAMSFALIGLKVPGVVIEDPGCTAKTYPKYFEDLARLCENK